MLTTNWNGIAKLDLLYNRTTLYHNGNSIVMVWSNAEDYQTRSNSAVLKLYPFDRVYLQLEEASLYETSQPAGHDYVSFSGFKL